MSELGKKIRLERITNKKSGNLLLVPMDHGLNDGTIRGLENMPKTINKVATGGADAVILHSGIAAVGHRGSHDISGSDIGLIIHLSGSTSLSPTPNHKKIVYSVEGALKMGADAVSIHVNIGDRDEPSMLEDMGRISQLCRNWGMPLLAMMYPRGPKIKSGHEPEVVNIAARVGAELGADIVKTNYTGDIDSFKKITKGCPVPIVIAGGPKLETTFDVLQMIADAMEGGAKGVAMGRNIFQADDPITFVKTISLIVHERYTVNEAIKEIESQLEIGTKQIDLKEQLKSSSFVSISSYLKQKK
ncbi:MAG: class I fructose-bisphosphate aldolase family protein [archaeon]|nr:class I fructose-bisphosphate aldolase family protein [archaeon]